LYYTCLSIFGLNAENWIELPSFDENLKDFQFIGIEPDFVTGHAFVHRDDVIQAVGPGHHTGAAARAGDP
jgi:hypothetical protein